MLDKIHNTDPEAVFVAFPFRLDGQDFTIDLNGIPAKPNRDQLDGAAKDWYPLQRWVDVSDSKRGVTLVPLDAPLVHLGGITTGKWSRMLEPEGPTIMSWALNNHWMVNFKASQDGKIPLRYRLTTHDGAVDPAAAARFAAEVAQPPVVLRDILSTAARDGVLLPSRQRRARSSRPQSRARTRAGSRYGSRTSRRSRRMPRSPSPGRRSRRSGATPSSAGDRTSGSTEET